MSVWTTSIVPLWKAIAKQENSYRTLPFSDVIGQVGGGGGGGGGVGPFHKGCGDVGKGHDGHERQIVDQPQQWTKHARPRGCRASGWGWSCVDTAAGGYR